MAEALAVSMNPARIQVKPGEQAAAVAVIRNRSEEVGHYRLMLEGALPGWAEIVPDQVSAFPLQETQAQVLVHPPADARPAIYHLTVRAISQERADITAQAILDVDVPAPAQVAAAPAGPAAPAAQPVAQAAAQIEMNVLPVRDPSLPATASQWRLTVRNAGNVLDTFSFSVAGLRPAWVSFDPPEVTLKPGEQGSALLTVQPTPDTPPSAYPFRLRAFSQLNLNERTEIALRVELRPQAGFKVSIAPREAESQGLREFKVTLTSNPDANADVHLDLAASDQDNACEYRFDPPAVFLPARSSATSTLRVRPRAVLAAGEQRQYTFTVVASDASGLAPAQSDSAKLTQKGAPPLALSLRPKVQTGELEAEYTLLVINPSTVDMTLSFAGEDPEAICSYTFEPAKLTIPPASDGEAKLRLRVRSYNDEQSVKAIPFTVLVTRAGELVPAGRADGTFNQRPMKPVLLELIPPQQSQTGEARYTVKARNARPNAVQLLLDAHDDNDALIFKFNPRMIALSAGGEGLAQLTVRPKDKLRPADGPRKVHQFVVSGQADAGAAAGSVKGILAQTRGAEVGRGVRKFLRSIFWLLKWVIFIMVVGFLLTLVTSGIGELACRNPRAGEVLFPILSNPIVHMLFVRTPLGGPANAVVRVIVDVLGAFVNLPPSFCP
jgi:hypothetical protein